MYQKHLKKPYQKEDNKSQGVAQSATRLGTVLKALPCCALFENDFLCMFVVHIQGLVGGWGRGAGAGQGCMPSPTHGA